MDPRIREHASIVADHSIDAGAGDDVIVRAPPVAEDLVVALGEVLGDLGANPLVVMDSDRVERAYLRARGDEFETPEHHLALIEAADASVRIRAGENVTERSDLDPATQAAHRRARQPVLAERLDKRWCLTQYPAPGHAQLAETSTEAYENFVWDAIAKDWDAVRDHQAQVAAVLDEATEVRIVSGETTDVTMTLADNPTVNDYGEKNLPGGEVFTAPIPGSVEGEVLFDLPLYHQGREIEDAYLRFSDGKVVEHRSSKNEATLTEVLNTDDGARRLGELGIGMNRDIDRFTYNMLYGDVVQRDGAFWFEDGF